MPSEELKAIFTKYPFHRSAFILPPGEAIYANDAERDQTFAQAVDVHEVPRQPVTQRVRHIFEVLAASGA